MNEDEYVLFVIEEKCNSKCDICMVEGHDGALVDLLTISFSNFKKFLGLIPEGKYSGIKFSGGEVTLNKQLPEFASYARDKGFRNIMIQTNARALSDLDKLKELKAAGINQYFVSFHGADKDLSDKMAGRLGAYSQTVKGLENLNSLNLEVISNTVMTPVNYKFLPEIGEFLLKFNNIAEMQFWGYVPMSLRASELTLPYALASPYLNKTIASLVNHQKMVCVKRYPGCLLDGPHRKYLDNRQCLAIGVKSSYIKRILGLKFEKMACCEGTDCWGLPEIYKSVMPSGTWMPATIPLKEKRPRRTDKQRRFHPIFISPVPII